MQPIGKYLVIIGIILAVAGALIWFGGNKVNWFGKLPGDIRVEREGFRFYSPIVSMLILSILLSAVLWVINRFFR